MRRPRSRKAQEECVKMLIDILEKDIGPRFGSRKQLIKHHIHKQVNNKYHSIFINIIKYLEDLRGVHKNKMKHLIRDYLLSVYEYYRRFNRIPTLFQISPASSNQIRFEEWIYDSKRLSGESYWIDEIYIFEIIEVPVEPIEVDLSFTEI